MTQVIWGMSAQPEPVPSHIGTVQGARDVQGSRAVRFEGKAPTWRAGAIANGLIRTRRAANAQPGEGFIRLKATGGGFYWVSFDGFRLLRGDTFWDAEELQPKFIEAMERAGSGW